MGARSPTYFGDVRLTPCRAVAEVPREPVMELEPEPVPLRWQPLAAASSVPVHAR